MSEEEKAWFEEICKKHNKDKPCPFCGGEVSFCAVWQVYCKGCSRSFVSPALFDSEQEARKAWNKRRVWA